MTLSFILLAEEIASDVPNENPSITTLCNPVATPVYSSFSLLLEDCLYLFSV